MDFAIISSTEKKAMSTAFTDLYKFSSEHGIVIEDTSKIRETIENKFKEIFGNDFNTDSNTPNGVLIDALTLMFKNVLGVNAQNANWASISQSAGSYLDAIGSILGVNRLDGETDDNYRLRLADSGGRGSGFAQNIRQAISEVDGVKKAIVYDNGHGYEATLPTNPDGTIKDFAIRVPAHSIFVCVDGGVDANVANAIYRTKSAGCGYTTDTAYGTPTKITIPDTYSGSSNDVYFYRPSEIEIAITVKINDTFYTGEDVVQDTKDAIAKCLIDNSMGNILTTEKINLAIVGTGKGIICNSVTMTQDGIATNSVTAYPYNILKSTDPTVEVQ